MSAVERPLSALRKIDRHVKREKQLGHYQCSLEQDKTVYESALENHPIN